MISKNYYGVIMAGGVGSRFWPLSRKSNPKQFLDILGRGSTLFQDAYQRLLLTCLPENIYVVTNELYRKKIKQEVPSITDDQILGEPSPKNTAPCIAYAAFKIHHKNPDAILTVVPSDHLIFEEHIFAGVIKKAFEYIEQGNDELITIGLKPTRPDTGYGYIQLDERYENDGIFKVKSFTEKPNQELAEQFLSSGEFFWNSGMFVWSTKKIINEFQLQLSDVYDAFLEGNKYFYTTEEQSFIQTAYSQCPNISIDYGILEKSEDVNVIPASFPWSDIGTWNALYSYADKDGNENVITGKNVFARNSENCIIKVSDKKLVALNGVKDLIIVETDEVILIADRNKEQEIRNVVSDINRQYGEKFV